MPCTLTTQVGMLTASRVLGQILNAVAGFLIVRVLFQYDYGTYRQILLLFTTLYLIGDAAFAQSLYHFVPRERDRASIFLGQAMWLSWCFQGSGRADSWRSPSGSLPFLATRRWPRTWRCFQSCSR